MESRRVVPDGHVTIPVRHGNGTCSQPPDHSMILCFEDLRLQSEKPRGCGLRSLRHAANVAPEDGLGGIGSSLRPGAVPTTTPNSPGANRGRQGVPSGGSREDKIECADRARRIRTSITTLLRTNAYYIQSPRLHNPPTAALLYLALVQAHHRRAAQYKRCLESVSCC